MERKSSGFGTGLTADTAAELYAKNKIARNPVMMRCRARRKREATSATQPELGSGRATQGRSGRLHALDAADSCCRP